MTRSYEIYFRIIADELLAMMRGRRPPRRWRPRR